MKSFILASLLIVAVSASILEEHGAKFQAFKSKHSKIYKNQIEETTRFAIFRNNLRSIEEHNALYAQGLVSYKQGVTKFADMAQEEFKALLTLHQKPKLNTAQYVQTGVAIPSSIDWRTEGAVTGIKDQGQCGSCCAFSVTGTTEGAYFRKSGQLVSLSEQQLVDCATEINGGCNGGYMAQFFPYIEQYGLEAEDTYPSSDTNTSCKYDASRVVTRISSYVTINQNEGALLEAVGSVGPVSVAVDASYLSFYVSGIYNDNSCTTTDLNHGVLVVGYGNENGQDYWIVKNSWGSYWGEQGYFRLPRGSNKCGIAEDDVYPIIN